MLDAQVEWVEPVEFPNGGAYHGIEGAKRYLAQSRAAAAEPEQFIPAGDLIVVFVHARVLPNRLGFSRPTRCSASFHDEKKVSYE
jgi:hypothetical protein